MLRTNLSTGVNGYALSRDFWRLNTQLREDSAHFSKNCYHISTINFIYQQSNYKIDSHTFVKTLCVIRENTKQYHQVRPDYYYHSAKKAIVIQIYDYLTHRFIHRIFLRLSLMS